MQSYTAGKGKSTEFVPCNSKSKLRSVKQDGSQRHFTITCKHIILASAISFSDEPVKNRCMSYKCLVEDMYAFLSCNSFIGHF